jgi:cbb3-type cytochrome oxidase maturation protein
MDSLFILIPITLFLCFLGIYGIFWALKNKQYNDPEGDSARIIFDDDNEKIR